MYINVKVGKFAVLRRNQHPDDNACLSMLTKVSYIINTIFTPKVLTIYEIIFK